MFIEVFSVKTRVSPYGEVPVFIKYGLAPVYIFCRSRKMKRKIFGFCLVFLFFGAMFAFSQNRSASYKCVSTNLMGNDIARSISSVFIEEYSNGTAKIRMVYNDGSPTEEFNLRNRRSIRFDPNPDTPTYEYDATNYINGNAQPSPYRIRLKSPGRDGKRFFLIDVRDEHIGSVYLEPLVIW